MRLTGPSWELIVIDNGSTDGTGEYLAGVQDASPVPVTVIANATNRGFPAAINQGLQYARGEYLVLLNNDVVVTDGWLAQLIGLASIDRREARNPKLEIRNGGGGRAGRWRVIRTLGRDITLIDVASDGDVGRGEKLEIRNAKSEMGNSEAVIGLVGPMSNYAAPPQLVEDVAYRDLEDMKGFARRGATSIGGSGLLCRSSRGFVCL